MSYALRDYLLCVICLTIVTLCLIYHPQNGVMTGVYPGSPAGFMVVVVSYMSYNKYKQLDPSLGLIAKLGQHMPVR